VPVEENGPRELRELIGAFNQMMKKLTDADDDRAVMLAGIAHDLKAPLTRLKLRASVLVDDDTERGNFIRDIDSLTRIAMQSELVNLWQRAGFSALLVTHDVEEALFLANRVIVLSDRPARIAAELVVDLPYPRHRGDPRLAELRHEALKHLGLDATW